MPHLSYLIEASLLRRKSLLSMNFLEQELKRPKVEHEKDIIELNVQNIVQ